MDEGSRTAGLAAKHFLSCPDCLPSIARFWRPRANWLLSDRMQDQALIYKYCSINLGKKYGTNKEQYSQALENLQRNGYVKGALETVELDGKPLENAEKRNKPATFAALSQVTGSEKWPISV